MQSATLHIEGMTCGGCVQSVRKALERVAGVSAAEVSLSDASARVTYDPTLTNEEQLRDAVLDAGYEVVS